MHPHILFLDFDGVLHRSTSGTVRHLPKLEALLAWHPEVRIVVSSTWKHYYSLTELKGWFSRDFAHRVIAVTSDLPEGPGSRQREIEAWLWRNPTQRWLALDDEPRLFDSGCPWLYLTDTTEGLTEVDLANLAALLQN